MLGEEAEQARDADVRSEEARGVVGQIVVGVGAFENDVSMKRLSEEMLRGEMEKWILVPVPSQPETASKSMDRTTRILGDIGVAMVDGGLELGEVVGVLPQFEGAEDGRTALNRLIL